MRRACSAIVLVTGLTLAAPAIAQNTAQTERAIAVARRLARSTRPAAAVALLLAQLDREAAREDANPGATAAVHEALVVLTAHDPAPSGALAPDEHWAPRSERQALARGWHALIDPLQARPFGELRRAGLRAAREAFWSSDPAEQFSLIRRLGRARADRHMVRLGLLALADLGADPGQLERAHAFGRRHRLSPALPAEIHEHCRVYCCV